MSPQEQGGPVIPPGTGFPFRRLLRRARIRWRHCAPHGISTDIFVVYFTTCCQNFVLIGGYEHQNHFQKGKWGSISIGIFQRGKQTGGFFRKGVNNNFNNLRNWKISYRITKCSKRCCYLREIFSENLDLSKIPSYFYPEDVTLVPSSVGIVIRLHAQTNESG
jgi:hypothetical protein